MTRSVWLLFSVLFCCANATFGASPQDVLRRVGLGVSGAEVDELHRKVDQLDGKVERHRAESLARDAALAQANESLAKNLYQQQQTHLETQRHLETMSRQQVEMMRILKEDFTKIMQKSREATVPPAAASAPTAKTEASAPAPQALPPPPPAMPQNRQRVLVERFYCTKCKRIHSEWFFSDEVQQLKISSDGVHYR